MEIAFRQEQEAFVRVHQQSQKSVKDIIASAALAAEQEAVAAAAEAKARADAAAAKAARKKERANRKAMTPQDKEALKEKRLLKLIGAVVVKCMSKHSKSFDRDSFKKYAKEVRLVQI